MCDVIKGCMKYNLDLFVSLINTEKQLSVKKFVWEVNNV